MTIEAWTRPSARIGRMARIGLAAALALAATAAAAAEDVNVRFSYKLKGEYGFFFMGQEKGVYAQAGLAPRFGEGASSQAALGTLLQGQDDLVVMPGIFAMSAIQKGMPVKIVALYQPAAPSVLLSHPAKPVRVPKDLEGKTVAAPVGETPTTYLGIFCKINNVDCSKVNRIQMNVQARVGQFMSNQIDVIGAYLTNDVPIIQEKAPEEIIVLDQAKYGLIVPGLAVVASNDGIAKKGDMIRKFIAATSKAVELTRADPAGATAALRAAWPNSPSAAVIQKQIEATSQSIPAAASGKPLGWTDASVITGALELMASVETIDAPKPADAFFTNALLAN